MAELAVYALYAISAASAISSGISQSKALHKQADQQIEQAKLARIEANEEAVRREEERDRLMARQRIAFSANGIRVTPGDNTVLSVMNYTAEQYNKEISAIRRSGKANESFLNTEADISSNKARSAVLSGFATAASYGAQTASVFV